MQPLAVIAVHDRTERKRIRKLLHRRGCKVIEYDSGYHIVHALAGAILGEDPGAAGEVTIVVVDAVSPGCSGVTIEAGLRDLGLAIPVILIWPTLESPPPGYARGAIHFEPTAAAAALIAIASTLVAN